MSDGNRHILINDPDGVGAQILSVAPGSDTGQKALAVRVISQLGAGSGGGGSGTQYPQDTAVIPGTGTLALGSDGTYARALRTTPAGRMVVTAEAAAPPFFFLTDVSGNQLSMSYGDTRRDERLASGTGAAGALPTDSLMRVRDTSRLAGSQIVAAPGDETNGQWVNVKSSVSLPVTGPLTDTQLRASAVPVSGTFFQATQPVSIAAAIDVSDRVGRLAGVVSGGANVFHVDDNASSLTVDAPVATPVAVRMSDGAAFFDPRDVSDRAGRLLGVVDKGKVWDGTNIATVKAGVVAVGADNPLVVTLHPSSAPTAAQPVTGTFFQATQPVSGTVTANQGTANTAANAWFTKITDGTSTAAVKAASTVAAAADPSQVVQQTPMRADAANLCVTNTAATGVACTLTIPAAAAGLFHYISLIEIQLYATAARTGGATPVLVTTTNLPGSPVWDFDTAQAIGVTIRQTTQPATPIKSSVAATATTIVAPIATTGIWRITAYYYAAP